jgi:hypothetical protein
VRGGVKIYNLVVGAMFEQSFNSLDENKGLGKITYRSYLYVGLDLYKTKWFGKKENTGNTGQSEFRLSSKQSFGKTERGFGLYQGIFYFPIQNKIFANYKYLGKSYRVISWDKDLKGATRVPGFVAFYLHSISRDRRLFGQFNYGIGLFTIKAPAAMTEYIKGSSTPDNNTEQDISINRYDYVDEKTYMNMDFLIGVRHSFKNVSVNFAGGMRNLGFMDDGPTQRYLPTVNDFHMGWVAEGTLRIKHLKFYTSLSRSLTKVDDHKFLKTMYYLNIGIAYDKYVN